MSSSSPHSTFPPTLVFSSVDAFVDAVQQRSIAEVGCVMLKRIMPYDGGMLRRHISFVLLTARDHTRDEVLACSVFLKAGDYVDERQLFTPAEEWQRQSTRADMIRQQLLVHLQGVPGLRVLDASYHVHPDVCLRFAPFPGGKSQDTTGTV